MTSVEEDLGETPTALRDLVRPHVDSFNYFLDHGIELVLQHLRPVTLDPFDVFPAVRIWIEDLHINFPTKSDDSTDNRLFPNECREMGLTYEASMRITGKKQVGNAVPETFHRNLGNLPIMTRSGRCHLHDANRNELVRRKEEMNEFGGYFIINGLERLIRLIVVPRRNIPMALIRPSYQNRGAAYTPYAIIIRCVAPDLTGHTLVLHYLNTGTCNLRFTYRKKEFFIPAVLILKALVDSSDHEIYDRILQGRSDDPFMADRVELMIRETKRLNLNTRRQVIEHLGQHFRPVWRAEESETDFEVGRALINELLFVHCVQGGTEALNNRLKFDVLVYMIQKLFALASGRIKPDNQDALSSQEVLLPGHLYTMILKEFLTDWLNGVKSTIRRDMRLKKHTVELASEAYFTQVMEKQTDLCKRIHYFISTGNLVSQSGMDLQQTSGWTIVAERLNYFRYLSHFRSVHRGQYFTMMKTTTVRKLLPEAWGFMCPVHTPDGSPCGLLNHLSANCHVITHPPQVDRVRLIQLLSDMGMIPMQPHIVHSNDAISVLLDGTVIGKVPHIIASSLASMLRHHKVQNHPDVPNTLEIYVVLDDKDGVYPSIILSTEAARMIRKVRYLGKSSEESCEEWIGPMEQVFMEIAVTKEDVRPGLTTHEELSPAAMLSVIASLTPFSDYNQSPRNMYQCQMGKQSMGTPFHTFGHRADTKAFRLLFPQTPIVKNDLYHKYEFDQYPQGMNAVVAVISYTGYDMEDAMIINKSSYERGFGHGNVYKYKKIDLREKKGGMGQKKKTSAITKIFSNVVPDKKKNFKESKGKSVQLMTESLGVDGLPKIGQKLTPGDPLYCSFDLITNENHVHKFKDTEPCFVDGIRIIGNQKEAEIQKVGLWLRYVRNPVIGDKFASRHGQKGVLSILYPQEDMPWAESGMTPDVIINPHAFPSRMTIGMLVESLAGKSGALHGKFQNGTPFQFSEDDRAIDHFGKQLLKAGYNYVGTEPLYSGITGVEMQAEIFIGVVYYQRLRHMVLDKAQVRATGPVDKRTRQPIGGRKVHGGIRFGEMERDSLLAHGVSYLLHDRLMRCSDYHEAFVCTLCGSILSPLPQGTSVNCLSCNTKKGCTLIPIPYVFIFLSNELLAMNIRLTLDVRSILAKD